MRTVPRVSFPVVLSTVQLIPCNVAEFKKIPDEEKLTAFKTLLKCMIQAAYPEVLVLIDG